MPQDLLQSGIAWLAGQLKANASEQVTYTTGATAVQVQATFGKTLLKLDDGAGGVRMEWTDRDFLIDAADLVAGGIAGDPQRGDTVTVAAGSVTLVYEVIPYQNEPPWRWSDPYRTIYRIHTKLVSQG